MALVLTITDAGRAALINPAHDGTVRARITDVGVSSVAVVPSKSAIALPNELKRLPTLSGAVVASNMIHVVIRDDTADAYPLRSFGLYLEDGTLFGVYGQTEAILDKTSAAIALLAVDVVLEDIDAAQLTFGDTNFLNPPATERQQGVAEIATQDEASAGADDLRIVTPLKAKGAVLSWLGFTPVQQGGGAYQGNNKIYFGWGTRGVARLRLQVDATDQGFVTTDTMLAARAIAIDGATMARGGVALWGPDNDGSGSGSDADLLDGQEGSYYANVPARLGYAPVNRAGDTMTGALTAPNYMATSSGPIGGYHMVGGAGTSWFNAGWRNDGAYCYFLISAPVASQAQAVAASWNNSRPITVTLSTGAVTLDADGTGGVSIGGRLTIAGQTAWHAGNDGSGSGLDADMLDGLDSSQFMRADVDRWNTSSEGWARFFFGRAGATYLKIIGSITFQNTSNVNVAYIDGSGSFITQGNVYGADFRASRSSNTGVIFFGADAAHYLHFDGTNYNLPNGWAYVNGGFVWTSNNDGSGSGLDADLLDGRDWSWFADIPSRLGFTPVRQGGGAYQQGNTVSIGWDGGNLRAQVDGSDRSIFWMASNDGAGSGLDADTLDGLQASDFARSNAFNYGENANGSVEWRPNGIIEQWGDYVYTVNSDEPVVTVNLPVAFSSNNYHVSLTPVLNAASGARDTWVQFIRGSKTPKSFQVQFQRPATTSASFGLDGFEWVARGQ